MVDSNSIAVLVYPYCRQSRLYTTCLGSVHHRIVLSHQRMRIGHREEPTTTTLAWPFRARSCLNGPGSNDLLIIIPLTGFVVPPTAQGLGNRGLDEAFAKWHCCYTYTLTDITLVLAVNFNLYYCQRQRDFFDWPCWSIHAPG